MKRILCLLIACLLLVGCGKKAGSTAPTLAPTYEAQQPTLSPTEPSADEDILAYRRTIVEAEMRRIMSTLWSPEEDIAYYLKNPETYTEDNEPVMLYADRIYQGLPYTHGSGSGYGFFSYASGQDENGVYTISGLTDKDLTGEADIIPGSIARQGCDCADTVFWAWARIASSISFRHTGEMTQSYGCLKVGAYTCDLPRLTSSTKTITNSNGQDVMFQAYAQLQKGDAMVLYTNTAGGHAVMVVDAHVEYTDGKIDGEKSYVVIIEQTTAAQQAQEHYYHDQLGQDVYICGAVDSQWSFDTIFKRGYLPVTCKELIDPSPRPDETVTDSNTPTTLDEVFNGTLTASYRIASVTVTVTQNGGTVQTATAYGRQKEQKAFSLLAFVDPMEQDVMKGKLDMQALPAGSYRCTVTCLLSTGNSHTVHDFEFTVA